MIIEFLLSVGIPEVAVGLRPCGEASFSIGGDGEMRPAALGFTEQRREVSSVEVLRWLFELAKLEQGWVEINQADRSVAGFSGMFLAGKPDPERDPCRRFPEGRLAVVVLFSDMIAVVRSDDDDGLVGVGAFVEGFQDLANIPIGK